MGALELVKEARKIKTEKHVPIIMITTEGDLGESRRGINRKGADRYIVKPFTTRSILRKT